MTKFESPIYNTPPTKAMAMPLSRPNKKRSNCRDTVHIYKAEALDAYAKFDHRHRRGAASGISDAKSHYQDMMSPYDVTMTSQIVKFYDIIMTSPGAMSHDDLIRSRHSSVRVDPITDAMQNEVRCLRSWKQCTTMLGADKVFQGGLCCINTSAEREKKMTFTFKFILS